METGGGFKKGRLARRLIVAIILFSTAITVLTTAAQLYVDYDQDMNAIHTRLSQIKESQLSSIVASVWFLDSKQVRLQLDGLRRMPDIEYLAVEVDGEVKWSSGKPTASDNITEVFPLIHQSLGRSDQIGSLKIVASLDEVFRRLYNKVYVILISNALKTFLVAGFIYIVVRQMITRHIDRFAAYAERFELDEDAPSLVLDRETPKEGTADELDDLARAINAMRDNLTASFTALKDSQEYNRTLFAESPVGQALCKMDGTYIDVNSAYGEIMGTLPEHLLGKGGADVTPDEYAVYDQRKLAQLEAEGHFGPDEKEVTRPDGTTVPVRVSGHLLAYEKQTLIWFVVEDITQVKKAQDKLKISEERFRDFAESSSDWLWEMDENLRFSSFSDRYEEITGIDPSLALGRKRSEINWLTADGQDWSDHLQTLEERRPFKEFTVRLARPDGTILYTRLNGKPYFDVEGTFKGYRGSGTNVTDIVKAEEELQLSEERFKDFAESSSDWFWEIDENYVFTYVSSSFEERTGISLDRCVGLSRFEASALQPRDGKWDDHKRMLENRDAFIDYPFMGKRLDGSIIYTSSSGVPIFDENGHFKGYRGCGRDETEMVIAKANKEQLEAQLRQAQRLETVGTLAGGIAHDFNNLLMPILGYTEIMLKQITEDDRMYSKLERIAKAAERAKTLVQQILTFSRRGEQTRKPIELPDIIEETQKLIRATVPSIIQIRVDIADDVSPVWADATQMHQMVMNLCTNATQAMEKMGGVLEIKLSKVDAELQSSPGTIFAHMKLEISDTGPGMDESVLERIFEPFFSTKKQEGGTGLGLATVHGIVASHNGKIEAKSKLGEGARFEILLPVYEGDDVRDDKGNAQASDGGSERILFVDDEPENGELAQAMLEDLGYKVDVFTDSIAALEHYGEHMEEIDLVITDQTMPNMTGDALVKNLRTVRKDLPVIMITGFSATIDEEKSQELGINKLLMKPVKMEVMAQAIREALD